MKRKNSRKAVRRSLSIILAVLLLAVNFSGCSLLEEEEEERGPVSSEPLEWNMQGSVLSVDKETGELIVNRPDRSNEIPMGEAGTWTIFVYLCGSDLESGGGMGTDDLNEMMSAEIGSNVKFVIETGGASEWYNGDVDSGRLQRFLITEGQMEEVGSVEKANMGDTAVLTDFLRWGMNEYPAEHMGLVFWNHGGGSISGVCFDENNDSDSLSLIEIDSALYSVAPSMSDRFEFIGFDACLMGTLETANVLASYSRYMIGSEEVEPGSGWDYTAIGNYLGQNPNATGAELGKEVCDTYFASCTEEEDRSIATLAVIDLEKLDDLLIAFNAFAKSMYETGADPDVLSDMMRQIESSENFGGNNKSEGYTNMVDLGGLVNACSDGTAGADKVLQTLQEAVVYKVSGDTHEGASGMSLYYPLSIEGSEELSIFETVCTSPYYLSFIDRQNLGASYSGQDEFYQEDGDSYWYDEDGWYDDSYWYDEEGCWDSCYDYEYDESCDCYRRKKATKTHWEYTDNMEQTGESKLFTFEREAGVDENGIYSFKLDKRGLENAAAVYAYVFMVSENGEDLIEIGETFDVEADWENGEFSDIFDGYWLALPDGQCLATYIVDYSEDEIIYTSPVLLNGKSTNLRIKQDKDGNVTIEGAWDGMDEHGAASKGLTKLKKGDKIVPCYYSLNPDTDEEKEWQGDEMTFDGDPTIVYSVLPEADYFYAFCIDDVYYDYYLTDFTSFAVDENGDTYFIVE